MIVHGPGPGPGPGPVFQVDITKTSYETLILTSTAQRRMMLKRPLNHVQNVISQSKTNPPICLKK